MAWGTSPWKSRIQHQPRANALPLPHIGYPDKSISSDLADCIPLVESISESGVFRKRRMGAAITHSERCEGLPRRNLYFLERARKSDGVGGTRLCREKTSKEAERGWVAQPMPVTSDMLKSTPFPPYMISWRKMAAANAKYA